LIAAAIRKSASWIAETRAAYDSSHEDDEFPEGKILTRLHQRKERNRRATDHKKRQVLQETSRLACEACGFDFAAIYGDLGSGFAECHHTVPVAELTEDHSQDPTKDGAAPPLCAARQVSGVSCASAGLCAHERHRGQTRTSAPSSRY
jgi:predicted HNH restriction endonuclease